MIWSGGDGEGGGLSHQRKREKNWEKIIFQVVKAVFLRRRASEPCEGRIFSLNMILNEKKAHSWKFQHKFYGFYKGKTRFTAELFLKVLGI